MRTLLNLFSIVIALDKDLRILSASDSLRKYLPQVDENPLLSEIFNLVRPRSIGDYSEALKYLGSLVLMTSVGDEFAVRGQLIQKTYAGNDYLVFCGAPWLSWMSVNQPGVKLRLQDFAPQDVQLDQLFYMSTEARMVADLEALNAELTSAKEEAESAQASKNAFFARMSHEMRTPLNGVVSALSLMGDYGLEGRPAQLLDLAGRSSSNLMEVINYVLDVSKIESEDSEPEEVQFDLRDLVGTVGDIVRARAMEKGLELRSRCDASLRPMYLGDEYRLRQAFLNLVINAIKFTDSGFVAIDVTSLDESSERIRIEVRDTGSGIDEQAQTTIFEPFISQSETGGEGTGLGLDIARRNVKSMGGEIGLISCPEEGSTFWIEVPLRSWEADVNLRTITEVPSEQLRFVGRVLLVDDNETNLMLGSMILEGMGVNVTQAVSGEQAVQLAMAGDFDLILMDISMPGIDGYEATRRIRDWKDHGDLPIVALTAYASSVQQAESKASGMNGYLTKPIERDRLAAELDTWLERVLLSNEDDQAEEAADDEVTRVEIAILEDLLRQIGMDNLNSVIRKFAEEAGKRWLALDAATNSKDLAREAHTLASTCRSFGLPGVADKLGLIEEHVKLEAPGEPPQMMEVGQELRMGLLELKATMAAMQP